MKRKHFSFKNGYFKQLILSKKEKNKKNVGNNNNNFIPMLLRND